MDIFNVIHFIRYTAILFVLWTTTCLADRSGRRYGQLTRGPPGSHTFINITFPPHQGGVPTWAPSDGRTLNRWVQTAGLTEAAYTEALDLLRQIRELNGETVETNNTSLEYGGVLHGPGELQRILDHKRTHAHSHRRKRALFDDLRLTLNADRKWPITQPIKYKFGGTFATDEQSFISAMIATIEARSCLSFQLVTVDPTNEQYILFNNANNGCLSFVGRQTLAESPSGQLLNLEMPGCQTEGTVIHEVFHALGMQHEQSRPDRNSAIGVYLDRMNTDVIGNFETTDPALTTSLNSPYDLNSVMQYEAWAFSNVGNSTTGVTGATMVPHDLLYMIGMGQVTDASFWDLSVLIQLYCSATCAAATIVCQSNGYPDPTDCTRCVCPAGVGGTLCDTVASSSYSGCTGSGVTALPTDGTPHCVMSPNYPNSHPFGDSILCNYMVTSAAGTVIRARFDTVGGPGPDLMAFTNGGCMHWVELKNKADLSLPGYQLCADTTPATAYSQTSDYLTSETNKYVAVFNARFPYHSGSAFYDGIAGSTLGKFKLCFEQVAGPTCGAGIGAEWGAWTPCHLPCGGCGRQRRTRCVLPSNTLETEKRHCNVCPCQPSDGLYKYFWRGNYKIGMKHYCHNKYYGGKVATSFDKGTTCKVAPIGIL